MRGSQVQPLGLANNGEPQGRAGQQAPPRPSWQPWPKSHGPAVKAATGLEQWKKNEGGKTLLWRMEGAGRKAGLWLAFVGRGERPATLNGRGGSPGSQRESEMRTLLLKRAAHIPRGCRGGCGVLGTFQGPRGRGGLGKRGWGKDGDKTGGEGGGESREKRGGGCRGEGDSKPALRILPKMLHLSLKFLGTRILTLWKESHVCSSRG